MRSFTLPDILQGRTMVRQLISGIFIRPPLLCDRSILYQSVSVKCHCNAPQNT